jgi:hypothetical protein
MERGNPTSELIKLSSSLGAWNEIEEKDVSGGFILLQQGRGGHGGG